MAQCSALVNVFQLVEGHGFGHGSLPCMLEKGHLGFHLGQIEWTDTSDAEVTADYLGVPDRVQVHQLTFTQFQSMNLLRCRKAFPMCDDWSLNDWAVALSGEVGELCNLLKKNRRGLATDERYMLGGPFDEMARGNLLSELADIITYADLMMSVLSAVTGEEVLNKFIEVSGRVGYEPKA